MKTYPTLRDLLSDLFPEKTIKNVEEKQSKDAMASTRGNLTIVFEDLSEIKLFLKIRYGQISRDATFQYILWKES